MAIVPESYVTLVTEVSGVEDYRSHHDLRDEGTVTLIAVVSAVEARGYVDAAVVTTEAQVQSTDDIHHTDAATVIMIARISDVQAVAFVDAGTAVTLTSVITAVEEFTDAP